MKYVLILIDKASTHLYEYGLCILNEQYLLQAMEKIINDIGCKPRIMRADRYFKVVGGSVALYLGSPTICDNVLHTTLVSGAPGGYQN